MANVRFPILCVTVVAFLVVMELATMASCSGIASVYIFNKSIKSAIGLQCRNKDGDFVIKPRLLKQNEHVGLVFTPNFWGTTRVNCYFMWIVQDETYVQNFDVWFDSFFAFWYEPPCKQCTWLVNPWGFTGFKDGELGQQIAHYRWIPKE